MAIKNRLMRRKKWYTLEDAAKRIGTETGEEVSSKDVAQFALEGGIDLYVSLTYAYGKRLVPKELAQASIHSGSLEPWRMSADYFEDPGKERVSIDELTSLDGLYRLGINTPAIRGALLSWIQGCSQEEIDDWDDSWSVFDHEGDAWMVYECGDTIYGQMLPSYTLPKINSLTLLREDIEHFISSLEEEQASYETQEGEILRALEAMGLLVDAYIKGRGPDYRHGGNPKISRIVDDMLDAKPEDVTKMSERKLKDIVSDALKAWEAKKRS
ncbi:hypothetical protein [Halomonas sp. H5]|uniref:hypothetical protein n=1 Tax=Halomonas sp. H5 TaxID=3423910 RepID=UPI003D35ED77